MEDMSLGLLEAIHHAIFVDMSVREYAGLVSFLRVAESPQEYKKQIFIYVITSSFIY